MLSGCSRQQPRRAALQPANRVGGGRVARCRQADGTHRIPAMDRWLPGKKVFLLRFGHQLVTPRNTVASRDGDRGSAVQTSSCLQRHRLHHIRILNSTTLLGSGQLRVSSEVPPMPSWACQQQIAGATAAAARVEGQPFQADSPCGPHRQMQVPSARGSCDQRAGRSQESCSHR